MPHERLRYCPDREHARDYVYQYVDPAQVAPYWDLAGQYVFPITRLQTQGSGSFTAHQDLIRGGTRYRGSQSLIDFPTRSPWGCDAPVGNRDVADQRRANQYVHYQGPFPCLIYRTLRDLLDAQRRLVAILLAGVVIVRRRSLERVRRDQGGAPRTRVVDQVVNPETKIFTDIDRDTLPAVSWVIPDYQNSDHPGNGSDSGPSWVAQVVNAIGESQAWNTTAILVVWDDWGGWYDHVAPPGPCRSGGLGFRVPLIAISPYAKKVTFRTARTSSGASCGSSRRTGNWRVSARPTKRSADFANDFFDFTQAPRSSFR